MESDNSDDLKKNVLDRGYSALDNHEKGGGTAYFKNRDEQEHYH